MRAVSPTYASPSWWIVFPVRLVISIAVYLALTNHRVVSRIAVHIAGAAQLPCPTPRIRQKAFDMYVCVATPCPVLMLYMALLRIRLSIFVAVFGRPKRLQQSMA